MTGFITLSEQILCCDRSPLVTGSQFSSLKKIVARDAPAESDASRATQRSQYLCVRDTVSLLRPPVAWQAPRKSRSRTVNLRLSHLAGIYETIRHGRDAFIYPHRGNQHSLGLPLISKTWRFCATGAGGRQGASRLALRPSGT